MARHGLGARHRQEVAAALVEHEVKAEEWLQPAAEAGAHAPHPLRDGADFPAIRGIEMQDAVRLSVPETAKDDAFGFQAAGHAIFSEVMVRVTIYTTEPCGFCRVAKSLLDKRNVPYHEINLAKDPSGRAELVRITGMMTFPQVVIDSTPIGGYQELIQVDRAGGLADLAEAAA
jgi:glutaredoxin 3